MAATPDGLKRFYLVLGLLAVAGVAVLALMTRGRRPVSIPANVAIQASDTAGFRGYLMGSPAAPVEITEYADYQCPGCQSFEAVQFPDVKARLIDAGRVRWRYRDYPLSQHQFARLAAHAAACAEEQGKFWELHHRIYEGQAEWSMARDAAPIFRRYAGEVGVEQDAYDACMESARYAGRIEASFQEGNRVGVNSTPTFLIGDRLYVGLNFDEIRRLVDSIAPAAADTAGAAAR